MDEAKKSRWERLEALWEAAHGLPSGEQRIFLETLGAEDPALRGELEALLVAANRAEPFFGRFAGVVAVGADEALLASRLEELQAGIADRYTLMRELGRGGMATVYLARDLRHGREVALKVLDPALTATLGVDRFLREIEIVASLRHPHILPLYDSGEAGQLLYYVMPYEPGRSLRERLSREGPLPVDDVVRILHDVVDALAHAHEHGIVHCDIKPENILLSARHATVADFGVARAIAEASRASDFEATPTTLGTPRYMAPEQASGTDDVDHRADIYAVGVLAWEMLAGRPPFTGEKPQDVLSAHMAQPAEPLAVHRPDVPEALAGLVMKCLEKKPADRWQRADELLARLEELRLPTTVTLTVETTPVRAVPARPALVSRWLTIGMILTAIATLPWVLSRVTRARVDGREAGERPGTGAGARTGSTASVDPVAQELYRLATDPRVYRTDSAAREALARLHQAVALDSSFAIAWVALAQVYIRIAPRENPDMPVSQRLQVAEQLAHHALSMDDSLANAHRALGNILLRQYRFPEAEEHLREAVRLDPHETSGYEALVRLYVFTGRLEDALEAGRNAVANGPSEPGTHVEYARALMVNGRCDLARDQLARIADLEPRVGRERLVSAQCYALEGKWEDAIAQFPPGGLTSTSREARPRFNDVQAEGSPVLGYLLARSGQRDAALAVLDQLHSSRESTGAWGVAMVYAGLRDFDQAFFWLNRSIDDFSLRWDVMEPILADLHADPRFDGVRRRLGLQNR